MEMRECRSVCCAECCEIIPRNVISNRKYFQELRNLVVNCVNIFVYKNGEPRCKPKLVNVPPSSLDCMYNVILKISERVKFDVGYPEYMYHMNGKQVLKPCELQNYGCYVVASNLDKYFDLHRDCYLERLRQTESCKCQPGKYYQELRYEVCNSINLHIYKNGEYRKIPQLVHIPPKYLDCMFNVMKKISERVKFTVGYPEYLYRMDGTQVMHVCELENYGCYVVATNLDKEYKKVCYQQ